MVAAQRLPYMGRPPPAGPAPPRKKRKGKVSQYRKRTPAPKLGEIGSAVRSALGLDYSDIPPWDEGVLMAAKQSLQPTASAGGAGGGETRREWRPRWRFLDGQPAVWNLLANAELMTPIGRRFVPDLSYTGDGLSPVQPRPPLFCEIRWNNVVSFEEAKEDARRIAERKTLNSQGSRGQHGGIVSYRKPQLGPPKAAPVVQLHVVESDEGFDDVPAGLVGDPAFEAANDHETLGQDVSAWPLNVAIQMHEGPVYLSHTVIAEYDPEWDGEVILSVAKRMPMTIGKMYFQVRVPELLFYEAIDAVASTCGVDSFVFNGDGLPIMVEDREIFDAFDVLADNGFLGGTVRNEFLQWSGNDLHKYWSWRNNLETGIEKGTVNRASRYAVGGDYQDSPGVYHHRYVMSMARLVHFDEPIVDVEGSSQDFPVLIEDVQRYGRYWMGLMADDDFNYRYQQACWGNDPSREGVLEHKHDWQSVRSGVFRHAFPPLKKPLGQRLKAYAARFSKWMDEPVFSLFGRKGKEQEPVSEAPTEYERAAFEAVAVQRTLGIDDSDENDVELMEYLAGTKVDPNRLPDVVQLAIQRLQQDKPSPVFSEGGIYLGDKMLLPQTKDGVILLREHEGVDTPLIIPGSNPSPR